MAERGNRVMVHVTAINHAWASEFTGYSLEEIQKAFKEADEKGIVCVVEVKRGI